MDIYFLQEARAVTAGRSPSLGKPEQQPVETFQNVLGTITPKTDKVSDTSKQFEALIVGQVLKAAREASEGGWLGTGDDQTGELALEMAEQGFAQALAARGGLGIAKMVTPILRRDESKAASSEPEIPRSQAAPNKDSFR